MVERPHEISPFGRHNKCAAYVISTERKDLEYTIYKIRTEYIETRRYEMRIRQKEEMWGIFEREAKPQIVAPRPKDSGSIFEIASNLTRIKRMKPAEITLQFDETC